jgi:hypothetical protein
MRAQFAGEKPADVGRLERGDIDMIAIKMLTQQPTRNP